MQTPLSPRQLRERSHYDERYHHVTPRFGPREVALLPLLSPEKKPHEQDWQFVQAIRRCGLDNKRVLEMGCGLGRLTFLLAEMGAHVTATDLSDEALRVTQERMRHYGVADRVECLNIAAENLPFPPASFDLVVGSYILHHIEIEEAGRQISRVLKPGGTGLFLEWMEWPPFDRLRRMTLRLFPYQDGEDVTEDERKMTDADLERLGRFFTAVEAERAYSFARLRYFSIGTYERMAKLDHWLYRRIPALRQTGGRAVITLRR